MMKPAEGPTRVQRSPISCAGTGNNDIMTMVPSVLLNDWLLSVCLSTPHHTALFRVLWDDDGITLNADIEYAL